MEGRLLAGCGAGAQRLLPCHRRPAPSASPQGTDPGALDYGLNRAFDAYYNDRAWFHGLQKRVMQQVGGRCEGVGIVEGGKGGA